MLKNGDIVWLFLEGYYYRGQVTSAGQSESTVYLYSACDSVVLHNSQVLEVLEHASNVRSI